MALLQVFAGSFRGKVLFENPEFINPNAVRAYEKRKAAGTYKHRVSRKQQREAHEAENAFEEPELSNRRVFAKDDDGAQAAPHAGSKLADADVDGSAADAGGSDAEIDGLSSGDESLDEELLQSSDGDSAGDEDASGELYGADSSDDE